MKFAAQNPRIKTRKNDGRILYAVKSRFTKGKVGSLNPAQAQLAAAQAGAKLLVGFQPVGVPA